MGKTGDRLKVWVLKKGICKDDARSRKKYNIDLTMDPDSPAVTTYRLEKFLQILQHDDSNKEVAKSAHGAKDATKSDMDIQLAKTYEAEDSLFLIKNNRLIKQAEQCYPDFVIDYTTDPPPPPTAAAKEKPFDFSLIEGWSVAKISTEHKRITEKKEAYAKSDPNKRSKDVKPLNNEEEKVLPVLLK